MNTSNRLGVRIQLHRSTSSNRFQLQPGSYLETGLEEGEHQRVLNSIQFTNLSGGKLFCGVEMFYCLNTLQRKHL